MKLRQAQLPNLRSLSLSKGVSLPITDFSGLPCRFAARNDALFATEQMAEAVVYLSLGANEESPFQACLRAIHRLSATDGIKVVQCASFYRTEPVSDVVQPWFINTALEIRTTLSPHSLLSALQKIEGDMGRVRTVKNGPRVIDVDILFYNGDILTDGDFLRIPHPELHKRRFVLVPMNDIAPQLIHPVMGLSMEMLLAGCPDQCLVVSATYL